MPTLHSHTHYQVAPANATTQACEGFPKKGEAFIPIPPIGASERDAPTGFLIGIG